MSEALMKMLGFDKEMEEAKAASLAEGITEGRASSLRTVMEKLNYTLAQAIDFFGITADEEEKYTKLVSA